MNIFTHRFENFLLTWRTDEFCFFSLLKQLLVFRIILGIGSVRVKFEHLLYFSREIWNVSNYCWASWAFLYFWVQMLYANVLTVAKLWTVYQKSFFTTRHLALRVLINLFFFFLFHLNFFNNLLCLLLNFFRWLFDFNYFLRVNKERVSFISFIVNFDCFKRNRFPTRLERTKKQIYEERIDIRKFFFYFVEKT